MNLLTQIHGLRRQSLPLAMLLKLLKLEREVIATMEIYETKERMKTLSIGNQNQNFELKTKYKLIRIKGHCKRSNVHN